MPRLNRTICQGAPVSTLRIGMIRPRPASSRSRAAPAQVTAETGTPNGAVTNLGSVEITVSDGVTPVTVTVDLTEAKTIGDVTDILESAIREANPAALNGGFPAGVTITNDRVDFDLAGAFSVVINDGATGSSARSLGLTDALFSAGARTNPAPEADLNPRVTDRTAVSALNPSTAVDTGTIVIRNGGRIGTVDVTPTTTIGELREAIARLDIGARLEVDESGNSINIVNELSGSRLSVEESGNFTATTLGVRTFAQTTPISAFNDGRGVEIADGETDPVTDRKSVV